MLQCIHARVIVYSDKKKDVIKKVLESLTHIHKVHAVTIKNMPGLVNVLFNENRAMYVCVCVVR